MIKLQQFGKNGSGKTTLLKAIIDSEMLEEGIGEEKFEVYKQKSAVIRIFKTN